MRYLFVLFILLISTNLYPQKAHKYVFFDACSNQTLELDYQVWLPTSDSVIEVTAGQSIYLEESNYLISTQMRSETSDWIATFDFSIANQSDSDTLYLYRLRTMWNGLLHPQKVEYSLCDSKCNGVIEEVDSNGTVRAKGKFSEGIPTSNIKFFNREGELESKLIYRNGNLKKIK